MRTIATMALGSAFIAGLSFTSSVMAQDKTCADAITEVQTAITASADAEAAAQATKLATDAQTALNGGDEAACQAAVAEARKALGMEG